MVDHIFMNRFKPLLYQVDCMSPAEFEKFLDIRKNSFL